MRSITLSLLLLGDLFTIVFLGNYKTLHRSRSFWPCINHLYIDFFSYHLSYLFYLFTLSSLFAVEKLRDAGYIVERVVCIVNRQEGNEARELMESKGIRLISLFKLEDLI